MRDRWKGLAVTTNPGVAVGPPLTADEEADHKRNLAKVYADEAEKAVEAMEAKLAGIQASLKTAKADAKRLRAEADGDA